MEREEFEDRMEKLVLNNGIRENLPIYFAYGGSVSLTALTAGLNYVRGFGNSFRDYLIPVCLAGAGFVMHSCKKHYANRIRLSRQGLAEITE